MKVMVFGTFDVVHPGHVHLLREAKRFGDELVVVVARDFTVKNVKGRFPLHNEKHRVEDVKKLSMAAKVVLGDIDDYLKVIEAERPGIIALGYDQKSFTEDLQKRLKDRGVEVEIVRISALRPEEYKSSIYKEKIKKKFTSSLGR
jgi:FAD synthetase